MAARSPTIVDAMAWNHLVSLEQWEQIKLESSRKPQLVYKHSTRCSISIGVKYRLEDRLDELSKSFEVHYLDLLNHRDVSNQIADDTRVMHESPQVIVLENGIATYHKSQGMISPDVLLSVGKRQ
jgi:bacillithiol system protein YtxJ